MSSYSIPFIHQRTLFPKTAAQDGLSDGYDIVIIFRSAEGLTKTSLAEYTNPYFVAKIDDQISFTSTVVSNTSAPKWNNEEWIVRNVPVDAQLLVSVYDKNDEKIADDYIGEFQISNISNYHAPPNGHVVVGSFDRHNGRFHLSIHSTKSSNESQQLPRYTFDGPCRYSRYDSLDIGRHAMSNADCIDSIWKIQLRRISFFFPPDERPQPNRQYKPPRDVFSYYPVLLGPQSTVKLAQQRLHERNLKHRENGRLTSTDDLWKLIFLDRITQKIQPRAYNYIIDDSAWQFSEIGRRWLTDSEVKHTRLANSSECVRFAGEFHLRPKFGWNRSDDEWELVFDNASGTYSPNGDLLVNLKKLLLFNFPGLNVTTYDYKDPRLRESMEQLELAAKCKYSTTTSISKRAPLHLSST